MASLTEKRKDGKLTAYYIRVERGTDKDGKRLKPYFETFPVEPGWKESTARKRAEKEAARFEKACKEGVETDSRERFAEYCDYVLALKETMGQVKKGTILDYKDLTKRIYPAIGSMKLKDIRPDHLTAFYSELMNAQKGSVPEKVAPSADISAMAKAMGMNHAQLGSAAHVSNTVLAAACRGDEVRLYAAERIAAVLQVNVSDIFDMKASAGTLSASTVLKYHRVISSVFTQAVKEGKVPFNPAERATIPQNKRKEKRSFQPDELDLILKAASEETERRRELNEDVPSKWETILVLLLMTGARRGELLGLKWKDVNLRTGQIYIENNVRYKPNIGCYEDTPKSDSSIRDVCIGQYTIQLLKNYKAEQDGLKLKMKDYFHDDGFVFTRDNGQPLHPDSVTTWMSKFSERYNLPHINPHAFRHTFASAEISAGLSVVEVKNDLGHASASTTANFYAHDFAARKQSNADLMESTFLRKKSS